MSITAEFTGFKMPGWIREKFTDEEEFEANFKDFDIYGTVSITRFFGIQGGYRWLEADYIVDDESGNLEMKGPVLRRPLPFLSSVSSRVTMLGFRATTSSELPNGIGTRAASAASARTTTDSNWFTGYGGTAMSMSSRTVRNGRVSRCSTRTHSIIGNSDPNMNEVRSRRNPASSTRCAHQRRRVAPLLAPHLRMVAAQHFERGQRQHHHPPGPRDACHLPQGGAVVGHALQHVERRHHVAAVGCDRDAGDVALGHGAAGLARDRQPAVGEVEPHAASVRRQQAQVGPGAAAAVQQTEPGPAAGQPCDHRRYELAEAVKPEVIGLGLMRQVEETVHARDYASSAVRAYLRAARATVGGAFGSTRPLPYR